MKHEFGIWDATGTWDAVEEEGRMRGWRGVNICAEKINKNADDGDNWDDGEDKYGTKSMGCPLCVLFPSSSNKQLAHRSQPIPSPSNRDNHTYNHQLHQTL